MASKSRTIAEEEWDRHKQTITRLYSEKPLKDVIAEMESEHGFIASKYQFETQLRHAWGIRKNTKRNEWEALFDESDSTDPTARPEFMQTTPAGRKKSQASFKRAKRYIEQRPLNKQGPLPAQGPLPTQGLLPQRQSIHPSPKPQDIVSNVLSESSTPPTLGSPFDLENTLASLGTMLSSPGRVNLTSQVAPRSSIIDPYDYSLNNDMFGLDFDQTFDGNSSFQLIGTQAAFNPPCYTPLSPSFPEHYRSLEGVHLDLWPGYPGVKLSISSEILSLSHFAGFEEYLHSRGIKFTYYNSTEPAGNSLSLSAGFALRFFSDIVLTKEQSLTRQTPNLEYAFQKLSSLIPGESTAVITQDQAFETKFIRILLFSLLNGFAGLNDIPIKSMLKLLGRLQVINRSFLMIIKDGPQHTSRTFVDNIFRAAIEAKDERVLKQLLKYQLIDINNTVCVFDNERYTPVERAASLKAFNLINILVASGADVNKTYIQEEDLPRGRGALSRLMGAVCCTDRRGNRRHSLPRIAATLDITRTVDLLIKAGTRVTMENLTFAAANFISYDIACHLSLCILPSYHQAFFQDKQSCHKDTFDDEPSCPMMAITQETDDDHAWKIIHDMIDLCKRDGCGECLSSSAQNVEWAAIEAAKRGHLRVVQLLINHVLSPTRIFSAAIRSKRTDLIDFVLSHNPNLDPCAHYLEHSNTNGGTTPLAEAVRAGNKDIMNRLHAAGALDNLGCGDRLEPLVFAAARQGNVSYMQMLLSRADNSYHPYRPPGVAIHLALQNGHEDIVWLLLKNGATVESGYKGCWSSNKSNWFRGDVFDYTKANPFQLALKRQNARLVRAILSSDFKNDSYGDYFKAAFKWGDKSIISEFILAFPTKFLRYKALRLLCMRSMKEDNVNTFREFLESVPSIDATSLGSCLEDAVKMGHSEMVSYLLDIGTNPFANEVLKSALPDHPEMLQLLFDKSRERRAVPKCIGANVLKSVMIESLGEPRALDALLETQAVNLITPEDTDQEDDALTPLGLAIVSLLEHRGSSPWMVKRLLQAGSDPNTVARSKGRYKNIEVNYTGLMLAIETGMQNVVQLLIDHGADVNKKSYLTIKRTPLQYAAELGHLDIVRILLKHGADVNGEPALRSGGTALQFAAISGNCNIAAELLNHGALLGALPSRVNGRWPLEAAAERGRLDMIQLLWNSRPGLVGEVAGFERRYCLRAMNFARQNGHMGCRDFISELSEIPVERLDVENYGAPWLAYSDPSRISSELYWPVGTEPFGPPESEEEIAE